MAIIGLSKLVFGKYSNNLGTVTYSGGAVTEKLASYGIEVQAVEDNNLYLDNAIAETDAGAFLSGTYTVQTGDLSKETSMLMLSLKEVTLTQKEVQVKELVFDDSVTSNYLGVGQIEMHQVDNVINYRAVWLPKVKFNIPSNSATTKGNQIEWQTKELSGTIFRSDEVSENYNHPWKIEAAFPTEEDALKYLLTKAGKAE